MHTSWLNKHTHWAGNSSGMPRKRLQSSVSVAPPSIEDTDTSLEMLMEMQDKLNQAVGMYGQILDGQQAYSSRIQQEAQQRQYYTQQQSYPQYAPPLQYAPSPNGYQAYAPPQRIYSPQTARAGPSLYPVMPSAGPYAPQAYQSQQYQPQLHQEYRSESTHPQYATPYPAQNPSAPQQWPASPPIERHSSLRIPSNQRQPETPQRHSSMTYGTQTEHPQRQAQGFDMPSGPLESNPSAPPAIDLSTHPTSPTASIHSNLAQPQLSTSYPSPTVTASIPLPSSPTAQAWHQHPVHQQQQPQYYQNEQQQPQFTHPQQDGSSVPPVQAQNLYSATSFPAAPAQMFPDAPSGSLEKQEQEEALLIEL
jgi:growth factor-regulated tyrosine kinase substrate